MAPNIPKKSQNVYLKKIRIPKFWSKILFLTYNTVLQHARSKKGPPKKIQHGLICHSDVKAVGAVQKLGQSHGQNKKTLEQAVEAPTICKNCAYVIC